MSELAITSQRPGWLKRAAKTLKAGFVGRHYLPAGDFPPFFNASCIIHSAASGLVTAATFIPLRVRAEGSWERMLIALMVQGHKQLLVSNVGIEVVRSEQTAPPLSRVNMLFDFTAIHFQSRQS